MPVHVANETHRRLQKESWLRRKVESFPALLDTAESVQADAELILSPGNVRISPDVLQPQGLAAGLMGSALNMEHTHWASEAKVNVTPGNVPAFGGPREPAGYCVKERKKVTMLNPKQVTMKYGRPAIQGNCPDCGQKIFKIGKL